MMSSIQTLTCLLVVILAAPKNCHGFSFTITTTTSTSTQHTTTTTKLHLAKESYSSDNTDNDDEESRPSSDLKALLPKPASRPLKMDKFGRRIYRMEDDTTVRHTKGTSADAAVEKIVAGDRAAATTTGTTGTGAVGGGTMSTSSSSSSSLSSLLTDSKQLAGDKSLQAFENIESSSTTTTDLKALLPTAKMRFMKLDKFGRRVQRMEDDGTVSYSRSASGTTESDGGEKSGAIRGVKGGTDNEFTSDSETQQSQEAAAAAAVVDKGQSLSKLIRAPEPTTDLQKDASTSTGIHGADLKALLPSAKMRFMKLDKFGRRVQRMEDDGTVSYSRSESGATAGNNVDGGGGGGGLVEEKSSGKEKEKEEASSPIGNLESESTIDLGTRLTSDSYVNESGTSANLKDLAGISKRPVFTKLDFKGGSVEDDRRMLSSSSSSSVPPSQVDNAGTAVPSSGLKELALSSKRPIFTKLDFKGGSVEDERRTKKSPSSTDTTTAQASSSSTTTKSNLKDLLPTRPTFTKLDFKGGNVEDERRTRKPPSSSTTTDLTKTTSSGSLQTLLPERKFMWRKREHRSTTNDFIGSVSGIARTTTTTSSSNDSVREAKQKAMREEVIASATAAEATLDDGDDVKGDDVSGSSEGGGSYSNLTDLLPQKKFVFRDTK